jgi:3-hydroxyisobutyrate dehydrogenase-like beta-hydroxyacid dehydrogenase
MSTAHAKTIGFIGTGLMGAPMAQNVVRAGYAVRVWNRTPEKAATIDGVEGAPSPAQAAHGAQACIIMVSDGAACREVLFGSEGVTQTLPKGAPIIVMSTIGYAEAIALAHQVNELGYGWVDAPVSGGTPAAQAGTLSIMVGAEDAQFSAAKPMLETMGHPTHIGPGGTGALTKLANQMVVASTIATVAEALILASRAGADTVKVREALLGGFANSRVLDLHGKRMIANDFAPGGAAKYQLKDTHAARDAASAMGLKLPVLDLVDQLFADLVANGGADLDHSALFAEIQRRNRLEQLAS